MNDKDLSSKTKRNNIVIWGIVAVFAGCVAYYFLVGQFIRFTEMIELNNGEVVIVDRKLKTSSFGEVGGPGGWEVKFNSMVIVRPEGQQYPLRWETNEEFLPMIFDIDPRNKEWYIVSVTDSCIEWTKLGRPEYPYMEERFRNGKWERVSLSPTLIGRAANVLAGINSRGEVSTISLQEKFLRMNSAGVVKKYIEISRATFKC